VEVQASSPLSLGSPPPNSTLAFLTGQENGNEYFVRERPPPSYDEVVRNSEKAN